MNRAAIQSGRRKQIVRNAGDQVDRISMLAVRQTADPLRVAHLHSSLGVFGAERWTLTLIKHLKAPIESLLITIGTKPDATTFAQFAAEQGFRALHISVGGKISFAAVMALRRAIAANGISILHTHGFKADVIGWLATRGLPLALVSTIHGWSRGEGSRIRFYEAVARLFLRRFDRVYPVSPALFDELQRYGIPSCRLRLVLNGVDTGMFESSFSARRRRATHAPFKVLFAGRLSRPKGLFDLLHAFAGVKLDCPATLVIIGDGAERTRLEELSRELHIASRVTFVGAVTDVRPFLQASDVLVLPSYSEGIPRVIMEAFAAGVPVVGSAIPGIQQLVKHESTGLLVPAGDARALTKALEQTARYPDRAHQMTLAARRLVEMNHSARRQASDFQQEYEELASQYLERPFPASYGSQEPA